MSARIGRNADLIQAGGGNTSIKLDGTLWVKASGKWLIYAEKEDLFLPVPLDASAEHPIEHGLRPSVETAMHAVIPHPCVIHVHSVNTLAWASMAAAPACFAERLDGLRWEWIPYVHPGLPLAQRIQEASGSRPDVFVMQNHGLIVAGDTPESAEALLYEVERRLTLPLRSTPPPDLDALASLASDQLKIADDEEVHGLATDPDCCRIASGGTLYPDHCVYLGHAVAVKKSTQPVPVLLCPGAGVLTSPQLSRAGREMLVCLSRVVRRIPPHEPVHYLDYEQVARLMNWDAEHYRQAIANSYA